jgi:hypothetical protein
MEEAAKAPPYVNPPLFTASSDTTPAFLKPWKVQAGFRIEGFQVALVSSDDHSSFQTFC